MKDLETECLVNGQIGLTLAELAETDQAVTYLEKCKDMSRHIKNFRLNLDALICLSRIKCQKTGSDGKIVARPSEASELFQEALEFAQKLGDKQYETSCMASLGILQGSDRFEDFIHKNFNEVAQTPHREINLRASRVSERKQ